MSTCMREIFCSGTSTRIFGSLSHSVCILSTACFHRAKFGNRSLICHNSVTTQNLWFFQVKVLKCYNFLWVQRQHNCSPAASLANCLMTLYLIKVHLQVFLSIPITQKCQISSCDTLVANEGYDFGLYTSWLSWFLLLSTPPVRISCNFSKYIYLIEKFGTDISLN